MEQSLAFDLMAKPFQARCPFTIKDPLKTSGRRSGWQSIRSLAVAEANAFAGSTTVELMRRSLRNGIVKLTNIKNVTDRKGRVRGYLQVRGQKLVPLPDAQMDSPKFLAA
jgi:hypothetical protein